MKILDLLENYTFNEHPAPDFITSGEIVPDENTTHGLVEVDWEKTFENTYYSFSYYGASFTAVISHDECVGDKCNPAIGACTEIRIHANGQDVYDFMTAPKDKGNFIDLFNKHTPRDVTLDINNVQIDWD